jgi:hypothetical protein
MLRACAVQVNDRFPSSENAEYIGQYRGHDKRNILYNLIRFFVMCIGECRITASS